MLTRGPYLVENGSVTVSGLVAYDGERVVVRVAPAKTQKQLGRYRSIVLPAITDYYNRERPSEAPIHPSEVHCALCRSFLGIECEPTERSMATASRTEMSEFLSHVEAHFAGLGVEFKHESQFP